MDIFGEPIWITDEKGNHIAIYDGFSVEENIEIKSHFKTIQTMVDDYPKKFPVGRNYHIVDNYVYKFNVDKEDRRVKLLSRKEYGGDIDEW